MIQITVADYFMGRDRTYVDELTPAIRQAAVELVEKINHLLLEAQADGVELAQDPITRSPVASGWRPPGVNAATANAAARSKHMTGHACDLRDSRDDRQLCKWAVSKRGREVLKRLDLYCERPQWTPTWLHVQDIAPGSGRRFFIPSAAQPLATLLHGETD